jgi:hypothetical protein
MPLVKHVDGGVFIPPRVAAVFAPLLRSALTESARRDGIRWRPDVWAEVEALEEAAAEFRRTHVVATTPVSEPPLSRPNMEEMISVAQFAKQRGTSKQAVTAMLRRDRDRLPHVRDERGRIWLSPKNLPILSR